LGAKGEIRTAETAAADAGVEVDQIVKSILFQGTSGRLFLFLTAGGNRVDPAKAAAVSAGEALARAEAEGVRAITGFAVGEAAPLGHLTASPTCADPGLLDFADVQAAAGAPRHMVRIAPQSLVRATGATVAEFTE
jgi:prolyl-tRNA editing enzyme YbaK/EbsC (Cys-tRNA(Pro) deacylase)